MPHGLASCMESPYMRLMLDGMEWVKFLFLDRSGPPRNRSLKSLQVKTTSRLSIIYKILCWLWMNTKQCGENLDPDRFAAIGPGWNFRKKVEKESSLSRICRGEHNIQTKVRKGLDFVSSFIFLFKNENKREKISSKNTGNLNCY